MFLVVSDRNPIQNSSAEKEKLLANIVEVSSAFSCGWIHGGAPAGLLTSHFGAFFWNGFILRLQVVTPIVPGFIIFIASNIPGEKVSFPCLFW